MQSIILTKKAQRRAQQRGLRPSVVEIILEFADLELPLKGGKMALRLSRRALRQVRDEHGPTLSERSENVVLILADGVLVTVLHAYGDPSRHYRRR